MKYKYIFFDLDGTIIDSSEGVTNSVAYALEKYNIKVSDKKELYKFIGPPIIESFQKFYGFSKEEANTALKYYREHYKEEGVLENTLYPGIVDLIKALKDDNRTLIIATSKPEVYAKQILEDFGIAKFFTHIAGSTLDGTRLTKSHVMKYAVEISDIEDFSKAVMIGDREYDVLGAKEMGLSSIGVLYGFGSRKELEKAGADFIATSAKDIGKILLG
ncbi:MAG: HAD family hydrolase [Clostridium sp.]|jgi:phosphoglycolate phosphatase|nr:HAD family hydrolase [Clostridium sp.]